METRAGFTKLWQMYTNIYRGKKSRTLAEPGLWCWQGVSCLAVHRADWMSMPLIAKSLPLEQLGKLYPACPQQIMYAKWYCFIMLYSNSEMAQMVNKV